MSWETINLFNKPYSLLENISGDVGIEIWVRNPILVFLASLS